MNEAGTKARQQIVDNIKKATNILIAVSQNPTVDDLSAALGLSAMLNKVEKHATAIFSGEIPPAINFLEPNKVFENTADSLRDFIIALDKEKADHLRYKIDGDYVKIFITPYRTNISSDDLEFSQGDFNVELVLALGVSSKDQLDAALTSMGQVIENITIATLTCGAQTSQLGSIDWHDDAASSLSEMIVSLNDNLKTDKTLLDKQISTALLTGIVSATDRFSNEHTSSRTMTTAAQLMAAGADQQLIATQLRENHEISALPNIANDGTITPVESASTLPIDHDEPEQKNESKKPSAKSEPIEKDAVVETSTLPEPSVVEETPVVNKAETVVPDISATDDESTVVEPTAESVASTLPPEEVSQPVEPVIEEPSLSGTLNATTEQAAEDNKRQLEDEKNKTILSHSYMEGSDDNIQTAMNGAAQAQAMSEPKNDIFSSGGFAPTTSTLPPVVDLPLPPAVPDFSKITNPVPKPNNPTVIEPVLPNAMASAAAPSSTMPNLSEKPDPSQFVIPGSK